MMLSRNVVLGAMLLVFSVNAEAAAFYVDQTAGNDNNNGSATTPWKNAPGMSAFSGSGSLSPGDTVYFHRARTWLVTGQQGLYLVGGVTYIGDSWGTGTGRAIIRANADLAAGVVRFRDHATFETVLKGFNVDANGKVTSGIDLNSAFYAGPMTGATKRIQNCEVHHVWSRVAQGQYKYGIHISDHGGTGGTVANVEILDTVVHDVSRDAICLYPGDENSDCRIRNVTVRGSEAYNTGQDPDYCCGAGILIKGNVQDAFIEYNYVHDTKGSAVFVNSNETNHFPGAASQGQLNIHIRHNILTNSSSNGAILIYDGSGGDPKDLKIYGNLIYNSSSYGGLIVHNGLKNTLSLRVYNNTFYNAPVVVENSGVTVNVFEFKNNIARYTNGTPLSDPGGKITSHSNNSYSRTSGTLVSSGGSNYTSANLSTYESSGHGVDPLFKNAASLPNGWVGLFGSTLAPSSDGLSLQAGSVGVNHGATLAGYATSINTVARPSGTWDLGAYEAGGAPPAPPSAPTNLSITTP